MADKREDEDEVVYRFIPQWGEKLAGEWQERAAEWLEQKWGPRPKCPYCDNDHWIVLDDIVELHPFTAAGPEFSGSAEGVYPAIQVSCGRCGNTVLVNALKAEVLPQPGYEPEVLPEPGDEAE